MTPDDHGAQHDQKEKQESDDGDKIQPEGEGEGEQQQEQTNGHAKDTAGDEQAAPHSTQQDRDSKILAQIAAASSSSLHLASGNGNGNADAQATTTSQATSSSLAKDDDNDSEPTDAFELVARLRSQITDLTSQVTSLNSKLVKSYTQTGDLEDELHETKDHEQRLQQRIKELEDYKLKWEKEIERGGWVEKAHVQGEMRQLMSKVLEETKSRETAVEGQKALETEIENLTSSLFDEANKMVAVERMTRAKAEEKMQSLEEAGATMKDLFDSVQVNLRETVTKLEGKDREIEKLKRKMLAAGVAPETPDAEKDPEAKEEVTVSDGTQLLSLDRSVASSTAPHSPNMHALAPPRLLTGALPFQEFLAFVAYLRQLRTSVLSRPLDNVAYSAGYAGSGPAMSMRGFPTLSAPRPANQSTMSAPPTPAQLLTPHLPLSTHLSQPFLKRCVEEDSDPALRLDIAPGFGFLSRRNVATAVVDGTLVIEPFFAGSGAELPSASCALCGVSLERWSKGAIVAKTTTPSVANVNSTMKKMLGGGASSWFSGSSSTSKSGTTTPTGGAPSPTSDKPTSPTKTSFTSVPFEFPSKDPVDPRHQIHIVRVNDTSNNRYAVCPSYCLARLRSVCEFWTYVRVIERGLLLEEGFKFVKGWTEKVDEGAPSDKSEKPATAATAVEGLGLTGATTEGPVTVTVSSDVENAATRDESTVADESESNPATSPELSKSPALTSHGNTSSGSIHKPPVPKRSAARGGSRPQTPVMREEKQASFPSSPDLSIDTRHVGSNGAAQLTKSDSVIIGASALGWEDYCWNEVVRLKECMFWTRMAAVERDTGDVVPSRLAVTGNQN
ncbi:hypothetical protein ACM66B_005661 [Microbotryomycetes sp. NB124-2]